MKIDVATHPCPEAHDYVQRTGDGRLCHLPEWGSAISQALDHESLYLVAREGGHVCGVLPLMVIRSRLFGNRVISQAFSNYGGPMGDRADIRDELLQHTFRLAGRHGCPVVEFRNLHRLSSDLVCREDKVCVVLPLVPDAEELWRALRPEIHNRVRKAEKSGLGVVSGGEELLDDFYDVWTIRMRELGTPCYPRRLFRNLLRRLSEYTRVFLVKDTERTLAAGFFHHFNGFVECRWAAARVDSNRLSPNTLLYWSALKHYCLAGQHWFDFGRSTMGSSQYEFKRRWGGTPTQLYYQYWTAPGHKLAAVRPDNPRYARLVNVWKRLPLSVTRVAGPIISRGLA